MKVLVVCLGNDLVADDAAGCLVHEHLGRAALPEGVRLMLLGIGGIRLLDDLDGEDLLVICDAVRFGAAPGTLHRIDWHDLPSLDSPAVSAHGIGLVEVMRIAEVLFPERLPKRAVLIGVEGGCFDLVGAPTPAVLAAIEPAAALVLETIAQAMT